MEEVHQVVAGGGGQKRAVENEHGKFASRIKSSLDATKAKAKKLSDEADWVFGRRTWRVLGVVSLFAVVVALLWVFLNWYVAPTKPSDKKDLLLALAQILAGTALLSGLYFTWRTLQVNREGQITERFTRAIDQLGATDNEGDKLFEIRIGGIYALERIARESAEDHWPIMEVLTAYVRQHAPWRPEEGQGSKADSAVEDKSVEDSSGESESTEVPPPGPDTQAIMTVLRRRTRFFGHGEPESLDLRSTHLKEANLAEANLTGAFLSGANLQGANLWYANLQEANLWEANLQEANLYGAFLEGANLQGAELQDAVLSAANLYGAFLEGAFLQGAELQGANLQGAFLQDANLQGANLQGADLEEADLRDAEVGHEQLAVTGLAGATMPNGQKYEDWLKDEKGSGKNVENE